MNKPPALAMLLLLFLCACGSPYEKTTDFRKGTVLVLPALDAVEVGEWHPYEDHKTGALLTENLLKYLNKCGWNAIATTNPSFTSRDIPTDAQALEEARLLKADFVLYARLGEFMDVSWFANMGRKDYMYLDDAIMLDSSTGAVAWKLNKPICFVGVALKDIWRAPVNIARSIAGHLCRTRR